MLEQLRQGDVLLTRRDDITLEDLQQQGKVEVVNGTPMRDRCILAEGEATGHAHRVMAQPAGQESVAIFMMNDLRLLHVPETCGAQKVTHEEHGTLDLDPGIYQIDGQREFRGSMAVRVMD